MTLAIAILSSTAKKALRAIFTFLPLIPGYRNM